MKTNIFMSFITEFEESNLDKAVAFYADVASEKRYIDINLKLANKKFVQNPKDVTKFAVVADYVSVDHDATAECSAN